MKIFHHHHHHHVEFALVTCAERMRNTGHREKIRIYYPSCLIRQLSSASSSEAEFIERLYIYGKALNLNRLSNIREKIKPHPQPNSIIRAISSYIYIQLDARPVEKDYKEIVYSWKSSELKSAEQREGIRNLALSLI